MSANIFSPDQITELIAGPSKKALLPTQQQKQIIESSLTGSTLVIAGAGSGKTETIANRVVWLVANGYAMPSEVLGLTFTRKAAGELAERVRNRLIAFSENAEEARINADLTEEQSKQSLWLRQTLDESMELPEIATYNSFAVAVLGEFGASAGLDGSGVLIDEASAWNLAREIVTTSEDEALFKEDYNLNSLIENILKIDRAVHENLSNFEEVIEQTKQFSKVLELPKDDKELKTGKKVTNYVDIEKYVTSVGQTAMIARIAKVYASEKIARGLLEYSDQIALAIEAIEKSKVAINILKSRYKFILLDEVQDTSVAQTLLLAKIFKGSSVMGVGDPHQSIYGWRGASSESLAGFHNAFSAQKIPEKRILTLNTSWRNAREILSVANLVAAPLSHSTSIQVPELQASPNAINGEIKGEFFETVEDETEAVASWIQKNRIATAGQEVRFLSSAIIFRQRKNMQKFADALSNKSVPYRIVGLGGLLTTPEVTDIVSVLRVLWYADAGSELIRIICGPKYSVGVADISGLKDLAKALDRQYLKQIQTDGDQNSLNRQSVTIVDALDRLIDTKFHAFAKKFISEPGLLRMQEAAKLFSKLRLASGGDLVDLIRQIETELMLDIELEVKAATQKRSVATATANITAFIDEVRSFLEISESNDLRSLLLWLERSERDDNFAEYVPEAVNNEVQLITVHSAKGLEWDIVAVPRLSEGEFPSKPKELGGWLAAGRLPDECRGDKRTRPELLWKSAETQKELKTFISDYRETNREIHEIEERRLIYVAVTRARNKLLMTGSIWSTIKTPSTCAPVLSELVKAELIAPIELQSKYESLPTHTDPKRVQWPFDPLGKRSEAVKTAAKNLNKILKQKIDIEKLENPYIKLLLAEAKSSQSSNDLKLPDRVNASSFNDFISDPQKALLQRMRPVPTKPYRQTRIGNIFHEWVERRTTTHSAKEMMLESLETEGEIISAQDSSEVQELINTFESSRWANLQPTEVEIEITVPFAGKRVVCKIDAVYSEGNNIEIVDWKTGNPPKTEKQKNERFLQLDLYRHAYSAYANIPVENIKATLFYVADDITITTKDLKSLTELENMYLEAVKSVNQLSF